MQRLESESGRRAWPHRASPQVKLAAALVLVAGTALMPRRPDALYFLPAALIVICWALCRMPLGYVLRRLLVVEPLILGMGLLALLTPAAAPVFLSAVIKANICVLTMLLLTWTTPFHEILLVLRRVGVPAVMLSTLALMVRYLPVLAEESKRMQRARASRTFSRQQGARWRNLTAIIGRLFIRSADRAERVYLAMCARGWK